MGHAVSTRSNPDYIYIHVGTGDLVEIIVH